MTTAREIADWHRAEAQRLKDMPHDAEFRTRFSFRDQLHTTTTTKPTTVFDLTDRIKLHERFAAWLENV